MEGANVEDSHGCEVKEEHEDFISPPVEVIICSESPNVEDERINNCLTEPLSADPLATSSLCAEENEACQVDNEHHGISQNFIFPGPSAINHLPPVDADPDPEQTRRLLDSALQEIISKVTKRRKRKRRAPRIPTDVVEHQGMIPPELLHSLSQPVTDCAVPLPQEIRGPLFNAECQPVNGSTVNATADPHNAKADPLNVKATPVNTSTPASLNNSKILQLEMPQLLAGVSSRIGSSENRDEMLPKHDKNTHLPSVKKHTKKRSAKKSEQRSSLKKQIQMSTETQAKLSTNLSPLAVPQVPDLSSNIGFETPSSRAKGGEPFPAGGTPASDGTNTLEEGAQEASGSLGLKTKCKKKQKAKELFSFSKRPQNQKLEKSIAPGKVKKDFTHNLSDEKRFLMPPIRLVSKQRKLTQLQKPTPICDLCGRGFVTYCQLASHMRLHSTSVRRYFCSLCKSRFGHAEALSSHARKRHDIQVPMSSSASVIAGGGHWAFAYSCNECNKFFQLRSEISDHLLEIHGAARFRVVQGMASAMMGMSRMRGAVMIRLNDPVPNSNTSKSSLFDKSTKKYIEGEELTSDSSLQSLHPSLLPLHNGQNFVSDSSVSSAVTPTSIRSFSRSSSISSSSSTSSESTSPPLVIGTPQNAFKHRLSSMSANRCPVHNFPRKNLNSLKNSYKNSYSKPAQLISKTHSAIEKGFEGKRSDGSNHVQHLKKKTVLRDNCKGNVSHKAKSHIKSKANLHVQVPEGPETSKNKPRKEQIPCPIHEKSVLQSVKDTVGKAGTKKIALVKPSHGTSSSLRKPLADDSSIESYESISLSDSESIISISPHNSLSVSQGDGDSVISVSSHNSSSVSKGEHRSFSNSHVSSQVIFKPTGKEKHSLPFNSPHSHITEMKSLKTQTSADKISPCNSKSGRKKVQRSLDVGENMLASPLSHSNHRVANSRNKKHFSPYSSPSLSNSHSQKFHKKSGTDPLVHHSNLAHKKSQKLFCHSSPSTVVALEKIPHPNLNSSISATVANQSSFLQHSVPNVSNFPKKAEELANCTPFLLSLGNPVVVLERIDNLLNLN